MPTTVRRTPGTRTGAGPTRAQRAILVGGTTLVLLAATAATAQAHEKWFVEDAASYPTDWSFALRPIALVAMLAMVVVTVAWRWVGTRVGAPELRVLTRLKALTPYVPRLLAIHVGVSLLAAAAGGHFLSHDLEVEGRAFGPLLLVVEGLIGVWFIAGWRVRPAAVALAVLGPAALLVTGPVGLLSAADLLGIAVFLIVLPPADDTAAGAVTPTEDQLRLGLLAARLGGGVALITLAFAEKLANPALARQTLVEFPRLDVFALVGLHMPTDTFVLIAGCTELLFGLLVISGAMPQVAVLVAGIPFNATLILFGGTEMLGHLPVYGLFLTLIVYGSDPATAPHIPWLPTPRAAADAVRRLRTTAAPAKARAGVAA
ncbi:MAG: hypothetical protein U0Q15_05015 [Kineosporiaceae bacterium]